MPKSAAPDPLAMHSEFSALGLSDLLLAREKNHVELTRKAHVVGTAIGYYLIRKTDPRPGTKAQTPAVRPARTFSNSEVRDYSWPCVLVMVDDWKTEDELHWTDIVPPALYLDERRKVPVCVVYAPKVDTIETPIPRVVFPTSRIGGGYPVILRVQGREHLASIGCLVRDGHSVYALTNRHVTGDEGEVVFAKLAGETVRIGLSSKKQLTRAAFTSVYPDWAGRQAYLNFDIGLIRIDDITNWTADVYGIGTIGPLADLGMDNLSLRLIDSPVRAYGCGSGQMKGAIKALFYRYNSLGGFEYIADFLIGSRSDSEPLQTHPGDSGTTWLLETPDGARPIATQWGGQLFANSDGSAQSSFALATCLSTVCNLLEVDVIRDWNTGTTEYWGEVGHFAIGGLACTVKFSGLPKLQHFMSKNIEQVAFAVDDLGHTDKVVRNQAHFDFVPLADVADDVWRTIRMGKGETNNDENNHFADMDQKALSGRFKGKTLLDICEDEANIDPAVWVEFYQSVPGTNPGALPFRVWQGYELLVGALKKVNGGAADPEAEILDFLDVAGCMSHYVGDACQPLHISRLHHGLPEGATSVSKKVHSVYETEMLNEHASEVVDGIIANLAGQQVTGSFSGGKGAATRVIRLMRETVAALPPKDIVDAYNEEKSPKARVDRLWKDFHEATIERMSEGCLCMADIWASAWREGGGEGVDNSLLVSIDQDALTTRYRQSAFYPSMSLQLMVPLLTGSTPPPPKPAKKKRAPTKKKR